MARIGTYIYYSENCDAWIHIDAKNKQQALSIARLYDPGTRASELSLLTINGR